MTITGQTGETNTNRQFSYDLESVDERPARNYREKGDQRHRPFISCDLETYRGPDGRAQIMLFGFSTGDVVTGANLGIRDLLEIIDRVGRRNHYAHPIYIGYGFRYEVSFFLRDMPWTLGDRLWRGKGRNSSVYWRGRRWEYLKGKYFQISKKGEYTLRVYECVSWFNSALHIAANNHLSRTKLWADVGEFVSESKDRRSDFTLSELPNVRAYWEAEQKVFVALMDRLRDLIISADLPLPRNWWGPSALTAACFKHYGVGAHMPLTLPDDFLLACRFGYYGGRFEQFKAGFHNDATYQYDITSAYPHTMRSLWSWRDSSLRYVRQGKTERLADFGLYHIKYRSNADGWRAAHIPHPFPFRDVRGQIFFPPYVEGWYWSPEIRNYWDDPQVEILDAWVIDAGTQKPFQWVEDLFQVRCEYKRESNPAEYVIKITINSAYGKTAQRVGWDEEKLLPPEFHQLAWAGYITSNCRAMVWKALLHSEGNVFQIETDAVFSTNPIPPLRLIENIPTVSNLGLWDRTDYDAMLTLQNGIYWTNSNGTWKPPKYRGLRRGAKGVTVDDGKRFLATLRTQGRKAKFVVSDTIAFYGYGHRGRAKYMQWLPEPKETRFAGDGKRFWLGRGDPSSTLVPLTNGITRGMREYGYDGIPGHTYPHHLPWTITDISREIAEAELVATDYE